MPFNFLPFDPIPTTNLRERLLLKQLDRAEAFTRSLLKEPPPGLSPAELRSNAQHLEFISERKDAIRRAIAGAKQQSAAIRSDEVRIKKLTPLQRTAEVRAFLRRDYNAAIAGSLEFERRQSAKLKRVAFQRAQAVAAARRRFSDASQLHGARGYSYTVMPWEIADPCLEKKARRREVLFARKLNKGWMTGHRYQPC